MREALLRRTLIGVGLSFTASPGHTQVSVVGSGFVLERAGSLTSTPTEVISGSASIKGSFFGTTSYNPYLSTNPGIIKFTMNETYRITFRYRIITSPSRGFEVLFYSPTAAAVGSFLPSTTINGGAGDSGTATLTSTLRSYTDYRAIWNVIGTGAIAIDDIQIMGPAGQVVAAENGETQISGLAFSKGRTAYALNIVSGGIDVVDRASGAQAIVPFGGMMTFDGAVKYSKPTSAMVHSVRSHLEAYRPWAELVDLPIDFLRTGAAWPSGAAWGQLLSDPPKVPDRTDKVIVGYINAVGFSAIGQKHPAFRPSWDKNGDALIDSDVTDLPEYVDVNVFNASWKNYGAAYWTESWRQQLKRQIDYVAAQHFDGVMLDVMTGYNEWTRAYPALDRRRLQEQMAELYRWVSAYAKSTYGNAFMVTANLDSYAKDYFPDLGEFIDAGYQQNAFFEWNGSGVVNGPGLSTSPDGYTNPIATFVRAQGLSLLDMDHLGTGPVTSGLQFPNHDDRINSANLQKLFRWAIESGFTPYGSPVFFGTPFTLIPRFVRMIPGTPSGAGSAYADWVIGSQDADSISTGAGDDMVYGGRGDDVIDGGPGSNTVFYLGVHANFRVRFFEGQILIEDRVGDEGRDTLTNVQFLQFADGLTGIDPTLWTENWGRNR